MTGQHIVDFYFLGNTFAGVVVIITVALALSRTTLWRVAFWLVAIAEVCLLVGAVIFDLFIWRAVPVDTGSQWLVATSYVLVAAGVVTGGVALILFCREFALRGAVGWVLLCAVALLILAGADSAFSGYTLVQIFDYPLAYRLLRSVAEQKAYYGVVSLLLVCAPLAPLVYAVRSGRPRGAAETAEAAGSTGGSHV